MEILGLPIFPIYLYLLRNTLICIKFIHTSMDYLPKLSND